MKPLYIDNLEDYLELQEALIVYDNYVLPKSRSVLEAAIKSDTYIPCIYLLQLGKQNLGFIEIEKSDSTVWIENVYLSNRITQNTHYSVVEGYRIMLQFIIDLVKKMEGDQIKFIAPLNNDSLQKAMILQGFHLTREHIQLEMSMPMLMEHESQKHSSIECSPLSHFEDSDALYDFMASCMSETPFNYTKKEVANLLNEENPLAFVVMKSLNPVAFAIAYINETRNAQQGKKSVYIEQIAVAPDYRRKGIAEKVINVILEHAKSRGIEQARLHVYRDNIKACLLYEKIGFHQVKNIGHWNYVLKSDLEAH